MAAGPYKTETTTADWLNELRTRGDDLTRARDWAGIHAYRGELRRDVVFWTHMWGPWCAVAAHRIGDPGAYALLDEVIDGGFRQPEVLFGELEAAFGGDPDWPRLRERLAAPAPPPSLELLTWPVLPTAPPPALFRLPPEREPALRARIPAPATDAWETATGLAEWVGRRWAHANGHLDVDDAVTCLERVDAGERFACVEYALVLTQALNAVGIPARRLDLRQPDHHVGLSRGHMATEAWIDGLDRWIVLDGQNRCHWVDSDGTPQGAAQLQAAVRAGLPVRAVRRGAALSAEETDVWRSHFAAVATTGGTWAAGAFVPVHQERGLVCTPRLERDPAVLYPDLSGVGIGLDLVDGWAAIRPVTNHPFADGFRIETDTGTGTLPVGGAWVLATDPGEHRATVAVRTRYGSLTPHELTYRAR
ncbi:transglutaminase domain-containing protein [Polymorphospora sp. NPDC050346]|uniref:transglutaminase domain-containing protein n=1 Tax=Polymorphospora sp. NPDC050346 TaxID=3155780 RepID=UPI0033C4AF09